MEETDASIAAAARRLAAAWNGRTLLDELPLAERPATVDAAYAIQRRLQEELGEASAGWKIGGASVNGLRASPSGQPVFGFLRGSCVYESGAVLALPPGGVTLEVEIAVRFGRQVAPASTPFDPALIDRAYVAIEAVRSRFRDRKAVGQPSFLADDAGFHAFVRGDELPGGAQSPVFGEAASLTRDGVPIAKPLAGDDGTDPLAALRLFWEHAAAQRLVVPEGAFVTTGTQTVPVDATQEGAYEGSIGRHVVRFRLRRQP
jgi:2-keto-4-pentenoate hydratase